MTAKSVLQRGRIIGFAPEPPVHAVDSTVPEADRATVCGLDVAEMYLWTKSFEDTLPDDRCLDCEQSLRPNAEGPRTH